MNEDGQQTTGEGADDGVDHVAVGVGVIGGHDIGTGTTESGDEGAAEVADAGGDVDDVASIVAQVRSDAGGASGDQIAKILRERLADAGQELSDDEIDRLAGQITGGD
ncbi:hypothetical protein RZO50_01610 [Microbacterium sp. SSW1-59]|uniref:hypothetical protein n=1 Tax=Microbacterium xanthum TaxID=3079794 RepID=UPI002AD57438|nr:hypothetical protein [Microbacterium sp. SSW1-59]MDZ8200193.1 hypothetical protein [Microbacterium sp. SSW1-59]